MNDNAEMFFRQLKAERKNEFFTEKELRAVVIEYVDFYNKSRLHSSLGYRLPDQHEAILD